MLCWQGHTDLLLLNISVALVVSCIVLSFFISAVRALMRICQGTQGQKGTCGFFGSGGYLLYEITEGQVRVMTHSSPGCYMYWATVTVAWGCCVKTAQIRRDEFRSTVWGTRLVQLLSGKG